MNKNKKTLILIICIFQINMFFSQGSGYMGKRVVFSYGIHSSPVIFGTTKNNETLIGDVLQGSGNAETGHVRFNTLHEFAFEFVKSSKWMLCLNLKYYKTGYDNPELFNSQYSRSSHPNGFYTIRGLSYSFFVKYYGKKHVAPWGRYVMFGPVINTAKTNYDPKVMNYQVYRYNGITTNDTTISNFGPTTQKFTGVNFMLGWGRSRIIANRIVIDFGASTQLFALLTIPLAIMDINLNTIPPTTQTYIESTYRNRVRSINRFNVFLKIGILL